MRPAMIGRLRAVARSTAMVLATFGLVVAAPAQEANDRYRVTFASGTAQVATGGAIGDQNRRAIGSIAALISSWPAGPAAPSLIFVAPRASACQSRSPCDADAVLFQRTQAAKTAIRAAANGRGMSALSDVRENFIEEVARGSSLPVAAAGHVAIDLRLYAAADRRSAPQSCPWTVLLSDAAMPPVVGGNGMGAVLTVANGGVIPLGPMGQLRAEATRGAGTFAAAWENAEGRLCIAQSMGDGTIPVSSDSPSRLHILSPKASGARATALLGAPACGLRDSRSVASSRSIEGDGRIVEQGTVLPSPAAAICSYAVANLPPL